MSIVQIGGSNDIGSLIKIVEDQKKMVEDQNKIINEQNKKMEELEKKIEEKDIGDTTNNINNGTINNGTVNNITNNITLVQFFMDKI